MAVTKEFLKKKVVEALTEKDGLDPCQRLIGTETTHSRNSTDFSGFTSSLLVLPP